MNAEQWVAVIGTALGAPFLLELVKKVFESRNIQVSSKQKQEESRDEREWVAMSDALERERRFYIDSLTHERAQWAGRLADIEARLARIQEDANAYQKLYWEERVQRERLQLRVDHLEKELKEKA